MKRLKGGGVAFALAVCAVYAALLLTPLGEWMTIEGLKAGHARLLAAVAAEPLWWAAGFFGACVAATALCFPAGPIVGIAAGALFGFGEGLALVAAAMPIGSTIAFLASRRWFRGWVRARLGDRLDALDGRLESKGALYLLALRWNPFVPYWLVNLAAGVTRMSLATYVPLTVVGLFPAIFLYVSAGARLAALEGPADVVSPEILVALLAVSLAPLLAARRGDAARLLSA